MSLFVPDDKVVQQKVALATNTALQQLPPLLKDLLAGQEIEIDCKITLQLKKPE